MTALSINLSVLILIYLNKYRAFIDLCLYLSHSGDQRTQFKNDFMKTTITDVAKLADVSMKTVSRVLNNEPNVAKKTREKVLRAAKELRYSPNLAAKGLASSKSYLIALLYDNPSPNYIANIQKGAIKACRDNNYYLVIEPLLLDSNRLLRHPEHGPPDYHPGRYLRHQHQYLEMVQRWYRLLLVLMLIEAAN